MNLQRKPLLLLHGALGASDQFGELSRLLDDRFAIHTLNFAGHGGEPFSDRPFGIAGFASQLRDWLDLNALAGADIFGYSMGGYVALQLARTSPAHVGSIFTLATKFAWDEATSAREAGMLDPAVIEVKVPRYAEQLAARHGAEGWKPLLERTAGMMLDLGREPALPIGDLADVAHRVMVGVGDRDKMVSIEETLAAYRQLPNGRLMVLPDTPHPLEKVSQERLAREIAEFFHGS
jgi:pimeloyl-ACP methyl ester carboxylesterase